MKRLAAREPIVAVPVVALPIEVQHPAIAVEVEVSDMAITVRVAQNMQCVFRDTTHRILSGLNRI